MPPEIGECLEDVGFNVDNIDEKAADVFSLGIALF